MSRAMRIGCAGWLLSLACTPLLAEPGLDTTLSLRLDGWSGERQLTDRGALIAASGWGRAVADLGSAGQITGQGWLRDTTRADGAPHGRVRELYWRTDRGPVSLRLGRQLIVWGRADGLNPTDNLSPRDLTLLVPNDADQRHGQDTASATLRSGLGDLTLLWMPHAASHTLPLPQTPGLSYRTARPPSQPQWAIKWEGRGQGIDGSVSYFRGHDPLPDLSIQADTASGVDILLRNQPARILGADLSVAQGDLVWRAEAAWLHTDSAGPQDFQHKKSQLWIVAGADWPLRSHTTLGLQLTAKRVFNHTSPDTLASPIERAVAQRQAAVSGQTAANQAGLLWRLAQRWRDERLRVETSGLILGPRRNGVARAQLDYALNDQLSLQLGVHWPFGALDTPFGQLSGNRVGYVQLRYGLTVPSVGF